MRVVTVYEHGPFLSFFPAFARQDPAVWVLVGCRRWEDRPRVVDGLLVVPRISAEGFTAEGFVASARNRWFRFRVRTDRLGPRRLIRERERHANP